MLYLALFDIFPIWDDSQDDSSLQKSQNGVRMGWMSGGAKPILAAMIANLMLVLAGGLLLWVEVRGLLAGRMQYKSFATERETSPVSFWLQAAFYAVLGLGLVWTGIRALVRG